MNGGISLISKYVRVVGIDDDVYIPSAPLLFLSQIIAPGQSL